MSLSSSSSPNKGDGDLGLNRQDNEEEEGGNDDDYEDEFEQDDGSNGEIAHAGIG